MIAAVVLAAGLSRRMGAPKLLLDLGGQPVIRRAVEGVLAGGVGSVVVVVPPEDAPFRRALEGLPVRVVVNPDPAAGQSASVRSGLEALPAGVEAVLIALGDQPDLPVEVIPTLIRRWRETGRSIVAPRYREGRGNPVLFAPSLLPELLALTGDEGARALIARDPDRVLLVDLAHAMPVDIDTAEDLRRLRGGVR
jgi:molybdenum cofactor cytidylyltransferase